MKCSAFLFSLIIQPSLDFSCAFRQNLTHEGVCLLIRKGLSGNTDRTNAYAVTKQRACITKSISLRIAKSRLGHNNLLSAYLP